MEEIGKLILTNNSNHIPEVDGKKIIMTINELYEKSEKGEEIDNFDTMFIDIEYLTQEVYEDLVELDAGAAKIFYKFGDFSTPSYIKDDVLDLTPKTESNNEYDFGDDEDSWKYDEDEEETTTSLSKEQVKEIEEDNNFDDFNEEEKEKDKIGDVTESEPEIREEINTHTTQENTTKRNNTIGDGIVNLEGKAGSNAALWESLINGETTDERPNGEKGNGKIILFGSSKGGTGKTFTSIISAYRYSKQNPNKRIAFADFDIIDGQVGITIHQNRFSLYDYYKKYQEKEGNTEFSDIYSIKVNSPKFPNNIDFYLGPKDVIIKDENFWNDVIAKLIENYDIVFFDSGIDYLNYKAISTLYKIADKIVLVSSTSIKSVSSVTKQIKKLKGEIENSEFTKEDNLGKKLNIVLTQVDPEDAANVSIKNIFDNNNIPILAVFGNINKYISKAEWYQEWEVFDDKEGINNALDKITELGE